MRFYYATSKDKVGRILRDGLDKKVQIFSSPELALSQLGGPFKDKVVLELRGLNKQSLKSRTEKVKYIEDEAGILIRPVPADKIRIYSGLGYSQVIDLGGPVTRRTWIDVGNFPKEK